MTARRSSRVSATTAFFGDIGAIFDLVAIRNGTGATGGGKDFFAGYAVHSIALQVPVSQLDNGGNHVVGIWAATERPVVTVAGEVRRDASSCRRPPSGSRSRDSATR